MIEVILDFLLLFILFIALPLGALGCWLFRREIRKSGFGRRVMVVLERIPIVGSVFTSSPPAPLPENVLASGNGKGNSTILFLWIIWIVCASVPFVLSSYIANDQAREAANMERRAIETRREGIQLVPGAPPIGARDNRETLERAKKEKQSAGLLMGVGILFSVSLLLCGAICHSNIARTYIRVYENEVEGKGTGKYEAMWEPVGFKLAYNQITSVDSSGTAVTIHASGAKYKCYAKNPAEIQRIIIEQQRKGESVA